MNEQIWKYIAELSTPGFFVTADIMYEGEEFPLLFIFLLHYVLYLCKITKD